MAYSIEIVNKDSKAFRFQEGEVQTGTLALTSKLFKQSLPDGDAEDAIIINLGREETFSFPIQLRETSVDAANGTHSSTVTTVQEKVDYLRNTIVTSGVQDLYTLNIYSTVANVTGLTCILENLSFAFTAEKPTVLPGSMGFSIGGALQ